MRLGSKTLRQVQIDGFPKATSVGVLTKEVSKRMRLESLLM